MNKLDTLAKNGIPYDADNKAAFHREGRKVLQDIATTVGLRQGDYDLRSNKGGIAVSGEITLHSDSLYMQVSVSMMKPNEATVLVRSCQGRKDYSGGPNNYMPSDLLYQPERIPAFLSRLGITAGPANATVSQQEEDSEGPTFH